MHSLLHAGFHLVMAASLSSALYGCATVKQRTLPSPVLATKHESLPPDVLADSETDWEKQAYRVGPGDSLLVAVYGHPELALTTYAGSAVAGGAMPRNVGFVVDNDGTVQFPLIGTVKVEGKTSDELRVYLEQALAKFVNGPRVTVQIMFNGSIRYHLLGQFSSPGMKYSDRPVRLMEAISLGGSVNMEKASLRTAYIARGKRRLPIDFRGLLREGDLSQNIRMHSGDIIVVPDNSTEQAFVFGNANGALPSGGAVPFRNGRLTLAQALASAGFSLQQRTASRLTRTIVIRSEGPRGQVFTVNARRILGGDAADFELEPGDVVFVPMTAYTKWNQMLAQLLPTLQTASGLLTPFVQMKYLTER